ncbi:hypothetical protein [Streptomyces sp. NPDC001404]|uniref:hypothetical protein n=1 Tax=Streptomyces sp. NPDC001404 TaxID=3364571 RepID=UPI0036C8B939
MIRHVYLDTEFDPRNPTLTGLLSIGLTDDAIPAADYYAVNTDADLDTLVDHAFITEHVLPYLPVKLTRWSDGSVAQITWDTEHPDYQQFGRSAAQIAEEVASYFPGETEPELLANWGKDDLGYLHRLYGNEWGAMPAGVPRLFTDLEVLRRQLGAPQPPVQLADEHHALADARFNRDFHTCLLRFQELQAVGTEELAERLHAAQDRDPDWAVLPEEQRTHHRQAAGALLDHYQVRYRPEDRG